MKYVQYTEKNILTSWLDSPDINIYVSKIDSFLIKVQMSDNIFINSCSEKKKNCLPHFFVFLA